MYGADTLLPKCRLGPSASARGSPTSDKTEQLLAALISAIKELAQDPEVRAVVASHFPAFANPASPPKSEAVKAARDGAPSASQPKAE